MTDEEWRQESPGTVTILRGLPGSGKSTWWQTVWMRKGGRVLRVFSADTWFVREGEYRFNPSELPLAHADCLRRFVEEVQRKGAQHLVVDNTNIRAIEIAPYYALALMAGWETRILEFPCTAEDAKARNVHDVPDRVIDDMARRFEREREHFAPWWKVEVPA